MKWIRALATLALLACVGTNAQAQTIDEIIGKGTINIGVLTDVPPFGLLGTDQQPDGYDADVAKLLGKYLGVKINLVPVTGPNRIPFLVSGKVDLLIATFGITPERAKTVMFSIPYSAIDNVIFAGKDKKYEKFDDLKGVRVGVPRGSVQDVLITNAVGKAATIMRFDDDASTFQAMQSGQVDAIAETGVTGDAFFGSNGATVDRKFRLLRQPNGMTMRANQWNLHQWVNTFVYYVKNNGELSAIHEKWFHEPLPTLPTF